MGAARWVLVSLLTLTVVLQSLAVAVDVHLASSLALDRGAVALDRVTFLVFAAAGGVVLHRSIRHRIGWVLLSLGLVFAVDRAAEAIGLLGVLRPEPWPGAWTLYWTSNWWWVVLFELLIALFVLTPDGRLPSRRWRWAAGVAALAGLALWAAAAFVPVPILDDVPDAMNPYGIGGDLGDVLLRVGELAYPWFLAALAAAALVPLTRWRRSDRAQRRAIAWFALAALLFVPSFFALQVAGFVGAPESVFAALDLVSSLALLAVPIAIAIGTVRDRLFDVERALVRSLAAVVVALVAGAIYAIGLTGVGLVVGSTTSANVAAAVASTAVSAVALGPLHQRARAAAVAIVLPELSEDAARVRVLTLGGFQVVVDGTPIPARDWGSKKARTLLKVLVARDGGPVPRDVLMEVLWPEADPAVAGPRLSVMLSTMRAVLDRDGDRGALLTDRETVALDRTVIDVDAWRFLGRVAAGHHALGTGDVVTASAVLGEALTSWGGEFLEEDAYEPWAEPMRSRCREAYVACSRTLAHLAAGGGEHDLAATYLLRILALDLYDERASVDLIRAFAEAGRHGEARRHHASYVDRMEQLGLRPEPYPEPARPRAIAG